MSAHSDEIWESFDALRRRMERLANRVSEMEARMRLLEESGPESEISEIKGGTKSVDQFSVTSKRA